MVFNTLEDQTVLLGNGLFIFHSTHVLIEKNRKTYIKSVRGE